MKFTLPKWHDLHTHLRQDELLAPVISSQIDMGCAGVVAMPNTKPPVAKIHQNDDLPYWSIEEYKEMIRNNGGDQFDHVIVPLYLTRDTTPKMIEEGAKSGLLRAVKYYPPHGTTGAGFGQPLTDLIKSDVIRALQDHGIILCLHGEEHNIRDEDYLSDTTNAEDIFYREYAPQLLQDYPDLKIVAEHVTTKTAVDFVKGAGPNVAATITPQHLLYTIGHLVRGFKYHLYCLPLVKFERDRTALRKAATSQNNAQFFAGTDNAPHTVKATECGCAAGCFTGGIAPQLYAEAFEQAGMDLSTPEHQKIFEAFLCRNGAAFYNLPIPQETMTLSRTPQPVHILKTPAGDITPLPVGLGENELNWSITV